MRYEVGVSILCGDIVWLHGPFPAGDWPDINIFRHSIIHCLDENERVEADDGYVGEAPLHVKCPKKEFDQLQKKMRQRVRCRQETANKRFKSFEILNSTFRHDISLHSNIFRAVVVLTQLQIEDGEPLFETTDYYDPEDKK